MEQNNLITDYRFVITFTDEAAVYMCNKFPNCYISSDGNPILSYKFYEGWLLKKDDIPNINGISVYYIDDRYGSVNEFNEDYWDGNITNETFTLEYSI